MLFASYPVSSIGKGLKLLRRTVAESMILARFLQAFSLAHLMGKPTHPKAPPRR